MVIQNKNISDQIYDNLKKDILKNKLELGSKIIVDEIAKYYKVSHTPAREALSKLSKEGLIFSTPNKVHRIFNLSARELNEIMEIRAMFECYSIEKVIKNVNKKIFEKIYNDTLNLKALSDKKFICQKFYSIDLKFHEKIIERAQNTKLTIMYNQIYFIIKTVIYRIDNKEKDINDFISEHIAILSSILSKDISKAKNLLKQHLEHSTKYYLENFINSQ